MAGWRLAELFVEISTRGDWRKSLDEVQDKFNRSSSAVGNLARSWIKNAAPTKAFIDGIGKTIDRLNQDKIQIRFIGTEAGEKLLKLTRDLNRQLEIARSTRDILSVGSAYKGRAASQQVGPTQAHADALASSFEKLQQLRDSSQFIGSAEGKRYLDLQRQISRELKEQELIEASRGTADLQTSHAQSLLAIQRMISEELQKQSNIKERLSVEYLASPQGQDFLKGQEDFQRELTASKESLRLLEEQRSTAFLLSAEGKKYIESQRETTEELQLQAAIKEKMAVEYLASPQGQASLYRNEDSQREVASIRESLQLLEEQRNTSFLMSEDGAMHLANQRDIASELQRQANIKERMSVELDGTDFGQESARQQEEFRDEMAQAKAAMALKRAHEDAPKSLAPVDQSLPISLPTQQVDGFAAKVRELQQMKLEVKFYGSDEGRKMLAVQKELAKEMGKTSAARNLLVMEGTVGKLNMAMKGVKDGLQGFGQQSVVQFAMASGAIAGLTRAASPVAFSTLTKSFELLSAQLGTAFIPGIMKASKWLQDAAGWVGGLDKETKQSIGTWAIYGAGLLGVVTIGPRIWTAFSMIRNSVLMLDAVGSGGIGLTRVLFGLGPLTTSTAMNMALLSTTGRAAGVGMFAVGAGGTAAASGIGKAGLAMKAFLIAHPVTAILGVIGAVVGLAAAFGGVTDKVEETTRRIGELEALSARLARTRANGGQISARDLRESLPFDVRERLRNANEGEREQILTEQEERARATVGRVQAANGPDGMAAQIERALRPFEDDAVVTNNMQRRREAVGRVTSQFGMTPDDIGAGSAWFASNDPLRGQGISGVGNMGQDQINTVIANAQAALQRQQLEAQTTLQASQAIRQNGVPGGLPAVPAPPAAGTPERMMQDVFRNVFGNNRVDRMLQEQERAAAANKPPEAAKLDFAGFQSQTFGADQAWSRLQTAALGKSPLENEIQKIQMDQLAELMKITGNTDKTANNIANLRPGGVTGPRGAGS